MHCAHDMFGKGYVLDRLVKVVKVPVVAFWKGIFGGTESNGLKY